MTDNPWAAWLREQEGAQVLPGDAAASTEARGDVNDGDGPGEFRGSPFGWDLGPEPRAPRRHLILAATALWVLILVVALAAVARPTPSAPAAPTTPRATPTEPPTPATPQAAPDTLNEPAAPAAPPAPSTEVDELLHPAPVADTVGDVGALLVRAALSAPSAAGDGRPARYVDASVVTAVEPAGDAQVVSVLALVLTGDGQGWEAAAVERYAVAVGRDTGGSVRAVAGPWALAPPAVPAAAAVSAETDPERLALATQALHDAGYRDITDLSLLRDPGHRGVVIAQARASAPGAASPANWTLWLRDTTTPTVLGSG